MNYPLQNAIYNFALDKERSSLSFEQDVNRCLTDYFKQTQKVMFNLMDSHDTMRLVTRAGGVDKALQMLLDCADKALEHEDVLEKIRAEIERKAHSGQWSDATMYGMLKAVAIIDKYREGGAE